MSSLISDSETILVAEHDQTIRNLVCRALSREGYRIVQASSAEEAVRTAARHESKIDLLVTETLLPTLSGSELAELVKLDYPKLQVVYIYASTDAAVRACARRSRVVALQNPFRGNRLKQAVREALDKETNTDGLRFLTQSFLSLLRRCWQRATLLVDNGLRARSK